MTEETVVTTEKKDPTLLDEVRTKSFQQILQEQATKPLEEKPAEPIEDKKEEEDKLAKEAEEAKQKVEEAEAARKHDEEIARKAAEEIIAKQKTEEEAKLAKQKAEEDEKNRQEALKPRFTGKDADGNVVPKSYEELHAEDVRVATEVAKREVMAELEAKERVKQEEQAKVQQTQEQQKASQKAIEDQLQKELDTDLTDLYANNKLPKIKDPKDENDPGNKEFRNLFETAQRVNGERMAKGQPPIRSIKLIYYEHYKPLAQPPGHDAPVMGSESPMSHEAPQDKYIPSRDRNKSMAQLIKEEAARLSRKLNVRGM